MRWIKGISLVIWTVGATQHFESLGWKMHTCEYCSPHQATNTEPQERQEKQSPALLCLQHPGRPAETCLVGLKSAGDIFCFFLSSKYKTMRPRALKGPKTDTDRNQKANANNGDKIHSGLLQNLHFIFYFLFLFLLLLLFYFSSFYLVLFVCLISLFGFLCSPFHIAS